MGGIGEGAAANLAERLIMGLLKLAGKPLGITDGPNIIVSEPFDRALEGDIFWAHIGVENVKKKFLPTKDAYGCLIDFRFHHVGTPNYFPEIGMWATDESSGPTTEVALRVGGRKRFIPLFSYVNPLSGSPVIYRVPIQPNRAYITGVQFLTHGVAMYVLTAGDYEMDVTIRSGGKVLAQKAYRVKIPEENLQNITITPIPSLALGTGVNPP